MIVHASLTRRPGPRERAGEGEGALVIDALWAHALPGDRLEHASGLPGPERLDLLFFLRSDGSDRAGDRERTADLLSRSHRGSPLLLRSFLPPAT